MSAVTDRVKFKLTRMISYANQNWERVKIEQQSRKYINVFTWAFNILENKHQGGNRLHLLVKGRKFTMML